MVESRAKEPILPLGLFRIRDFTASVMAFFLAAMGFFAAVVFLPRWFQVVQRQLRHRVRLPDPAAAAGPHRVGHRHRADRVGAPKRYKALTVAALLVTALGLFLLTNMRPGHARCRMLWLWMAITGVGVGPTFAVFTLVVQNAVPVRFLGTATSSLTLFQQVGGTIGLAITGTIFGSVLLEEMPKRMVEAGVPAQFAGQFGSGGSDFLNSISNVGGDLGAAILCAGAGAVQVSRRAVHPRHGGRDLPGDLDRHRRRRSCWASSPRCWRRWWCWS